MLSSPSSLYYTRFLMNECITTQLHAKPTSTHKLYTIISVPISSLFSDEDRITPTCRLNRLIVLALTVSFPPNAAVHCDRVASWKEQPGATGTSPRVCLTLQGVGGQKICNGLLVVNKYRQPCFPTTTPIAKRLLPAHTHTHGRQSSVKGSGQPLGSARCINWSCSGTRLHTYTVSERKGSTNLWQKWKVVDGEDSGMHTIVCNGMQNANEPSDVTSFLPWRVLKLWNAHGSKKSMDWDCCVSERDT